MKLIVSFVFVLCLYPLARADVAVIDTFGSHQVTLEQILAVAKPDIDQFVTAVLARDEKSMGPAYKAALAKIEKLRHFALVKLSIIQYPPPHKSTYLTVDLVDEADRKKRMDFMPEPTGEFADPGRLLAAWDTYQDLSLKLMLAGDLKPAEKCPVFHCLVGFEDPRLQKFGTQFNEQVPKFEGTLYRIVREDKDAHHRASAVFLLAHTRDGEKLVRNLALSVRDNSDEVRNNVMRVYGYIGQYHPELAIPVKAMTEALDFPTATDRNKALFALFSISKLPGQRGYLVTSIGELLVSILKLQQPNNHDLAYGVLKNLSGKNYGERDYAAWEKWLASQAHHE